MVLTVLLMFGGVTDVGGVNDVDGVTDVGVLLTLVVL